MSRTTKTAAVREPVIERDDEQLAPEDVMERRAREADLLGEIDKISGAAKSLAGEKMFAFKGIREGEIIRKLHELKGNVEHAMVLAGRGVAAAMLVIALSVVSGCCSQAQTAAGDTHRLDSHCSNGQCSAK